ncbi:hypothetical protein MLD38_014480 [Melastoma candidum]|uniref:Uncharacterized protein n=1 Tax=Melastoma candidum TaxID=119954 RepID=A0ACB9RC91_9MYRT|nr:hypothetical protein MLD38_014480 [Melastoma candidum]
MPSSGPLIPAPSIAADPDMLRRRADKSKGIKLALVLSLSMICLLAGFRFLAFGCKRRSHLRAVKRVSYKEEEKDFRPFLISGRFDDMGCWC